MELTIVEGVHIHRGVCVYEVVENDDWKFTSHGFFHSKQEAELCIEGFLARYAALESAYEQQQMGSGY